MTVPAVERCDPPINEIVTYPKIKTRSTTSATNELNETFPNVPQISNASHEVNDSTKNIRQRRRVLTRYHSEPSLTIMDDQHTINSKRTRIRKRAKKKRKEESHNDRKSMQRRDVRRMMPGRVNSTRSLIENKRWKAYRASQGSSNSIAWTSSRCHGKSMDISILRLSGD
jgi:hypothetical protein